jgi:hypothetical protein
VIKYRLTCSEAHEFEAWFASSVSFDAQERDRQIECPECGCRDVAKAMAPDVAIRERTEQSTAASPDHVLLRETVRHLRQTLVAGAEEVGPRSPEDAGRIHYGEAEKRSICGTATGEEAQELDDEGIEIDFVPALPEDSN